VAPLLRGLRVSFQQVQPALHQPGATSGVPRGVDVLGVAA
jgi:hypothetical protein